MLSKSHHDIIILQELERDLPSVVYLLFYTFEMRSVTLCLWGVSTLSWLSHWHLLVLLFLKYDPLHDLFFFSHKQTVFSHFVFIWECWTLSLSTAPTAPQTTQWLTAFWSVLPHPAGATVMGDHDNTKEREGEEGDSNTSTGYVCQISVGWGRVQTHYALYCEQYSLCRLINFKFNVSPSWRQWEPASSAREQRQWLSQIFSLTVGTPYLGWWYSAKGSLKIAEM